MGRDVCVCGGGGGYHKVVPHLEVEWGMCEKMLPPLFRVPCQSLSQPA